MSGQAKPASSRNMHATILAVIGIIAFVIGVAIATIPGTGLRGSGLGTVFIVIGVVLVFIAILRLYYKRA